MKVKLGTAIGLHFIRQAIIVEKEHSSPAV